MLVPRDANPLSNSAAVTLAPAQPYSRWGWLPTLTLVNAVALLMVAIAFNGSRAGAAWAEPLFWTAYVVMVAPVSYRLVGVHASRLERLGLVTSLGVALYLIKVTYSPTYFTFFDELQHYQTATTILDTGRLFQFNPILGVSPQYPGLEVITAALVNFTGLGVYEAGLLLVGVARLLFMLALFLFYEQVSGSHEAAGLGALVYMANLHFVLFDAQFAYESLALPLLVTTLLLAALAARAQGGQRRVLAVMALVMLSSVVITHHITSYVLVVLLALTWVFSWRWFNNRPTLWRPGLLTLFATVLVIVWTVVVAVSVTRYLLPNVITAFQETLGVMAGQEEARPLFEPSGGQATPDWIRYTGIASTLLLLGLVPFGGWTAVRRIRTSLAPVLVGFAVLYPVSLIMRLSPRGLAVGTRAIPFIFLGLAFVVAVGLLYLQARLKHRRGLNLVFSAVLTLILVGSLAPAMWSWGFPRAYVPTSYTRSVDLQGILTAEWFREALGPDHRIGGEDPVLWLMAAYGDQRAVTPDADRIWLEALFESGRLDEEDLALLRHADLDYLVIDRRLDFGSQPDSLQRPDLALLTVSKFDGLAGASRISDSGDLVIYAIPSNAELE